jgi:predicted nucleotidyltransferase
MDVFEKDILDFFHLLNKHSVRYILVGGLAVNYHGFSRSTGDVDLWLDDSKENRIQFVEALREKKIEGCEAFLTYPFLAGFAEILLENGIYIDLMSDLQFFKQDQFDECYQLSNVFKINDIVQFKVLHINKLIEEKGRSARTKDKEDAEQLKKLYKK